MASVPFEKNKQTPHTFRIPCPQQIHSKYNTHNYTTRNYLNDWQRANAKKEMAAPLSCAAGSLHTVRQRYLSLFATYTGDLSLIICLKRVHVVCITIYIYICVWVSLATDWTLQNYFRHVMLKVFTGWTCAAMSEAPYTKAQWDLNVFRNVQISSANFFICFKTTWNKLAHCSEKSWLREKSVSFCNGSHSKTVQFYIELCRSGMKAILPQNEQLFLWVHYIFVR